MPTYQFNATPRQEIPNRKIRLTNVTARNQSHTQICVPASVRRGFSALPNKGTSSDQNQYHQEREISIPPFPFQDIAFHVFPQLPRPLSPQKSMCSKYHCHLIWFCPHSELQSKVLEICFFKKGDTLREPFKNYLADFVR